MPPKKPASPPQTVDVLTLRLALRGGDKHARRKAAEALGGARDHASRADLDAALHDPDEGLRSRAASALAALASDDALDALLRRLPHERRPRPLEALIGAIGRFPCARAADALGDLLRREGHLPPVGWALRGALGSLGAHGLRAAAPCLDAPVAVAVHAAGALGNTRDAAAVAPLLDAFARSREGALDEAIVAALGCIIAPASTAALVDVLVRDPRMLGMKAAAALVQHGTAGIDAVRPLLRAPDGAAARAVFTLASSPVGLGDVADIVPLLLRRDAMTWARMALARSHGGLDAVCAACDTLADGLCAADADTVYAAAWSLGWIATARPEALTDHGLDRLFDAFATPAHDARARVADAVAPLHPRGAARSVAALRHPDAWVRHTAVMTVAQYPVGVPEAAHDLAAMLDVEGLAIWALEALRRIGPAARAALVRVADGDGEGARRARHQLALWG
jgi:HEAT repeat protein